MLLSPSLDRQNSAPTESQSKDLVTSLFPPRESFIRGLSNNGEQVNLQVLVLVCGLLKREDYLRLSPVLWGHYLDNRNRAILPLVSDRSVIAVSAIVDRDKSLILNQRSSRRHL